MNSLEKSGVQILKFKNITLVLKIFVINYK